jgi:hypothetical protein
MRIRIYREEQGQVLVQVAISFIVLLAFVSLAFDMGNVYAERRRMQNAADAGALAAARELCVSNDPSLAHDAAAEYMEYNGVALADIGEGDIDIQGNIINVTARKTADTFIAGIIGFGSVDVAAEAGAACGAATSACGLWPLAFSEVVWERISDQCEKSFLVWDDGKDLACDPAYQGGTELCDCWQCIHPTDKYEMVIFQEAGRAWLDYSEALLPYTNPCPDDGGCGTAELVCQIENNFGTRVDLPKCVSGTTGVKAGAKNAIEKRIGDVLKVAAYNAINECTSANCGSGNTFTVSSFGCIEVVKWWQNFPIEPKPEYKTWYDNTYRGNLRGTQFKAIEAKVSCDSGQCFTSCGGTDGTPAESWQLKAVSLTK